MNYSKSWRLAREDQNESEKQSQQNGPKHLKIVHLKHVLTPQRGEGAALYVEDKLIGS